MIVGIGETIVDILFKNGQPVSATPGGSTFNTMISLGRLNIPACFVSEIGNDHLGGVVKQFLIDNNLSTNYLYQFSDGKTPIALAFLDDNNNADYTFYKEYPQQRLAIDFPTFQANDILIFGSYFSINPILRNKVLKLLHDAIQSNAIVYYDPNYRKSHISELHQLKSTIEENFSLSDIVRGSDEDFYTIYGEKDMDKVYAKVSDFCPVLICTLGADGVLLYTPKVRKHYATPAIKVVSTIGAGDSFNAGMLYAMHKFRITKAELPHLKEETWDSLIHYAVLFASDVCQHYENYISEKFVKEL